MSRPIKVLHVIKSLGRGGAEMLLPETLRLHDKSMFEFHYVYFLPWKDQMVLSIKEEGGYVTCIPAGNNVMLMLQIRKLVRYIRDHRIDIVHAHLPWAGIIARLAGRLTNVPTVYTEHNKQERYHRMTRVMNLATMNWLTLVVAVSLDVEESIRKNKSGLRIPVRTILNGVNTDRFRRDRSKNTSLRVQLNIPANAPIIGTVAVFRFQKRLDVWLDVAAAILKVNPDTHFVIVGDGPLRQKLVEKASSTGLDKNVRFAGLQTDVRAYFGLFDVYMMTSLFEGLPIALLEAMASECAVVTTNAGGIKEVIRNGDEGMMCGVEEPEKLVDFAVSLLGDASLRARYGQYARARVLESFSMQRMVAGLESCYKSLKSSLSD